MQHIVMVDGGTQTGYTISADAVTDTFTLIAGDNITLHGDLGADSIKISSSGGGGGGSDPLRLGYGLVGTPSYSFSSDTDTGMFYNQVGSNTLAFAFGGAVKIHAFSEMEFNGSLDMNGWPVYDAYEFRCRSTGSASNTTFTWDSYQTSGMYYDSGVSFATGGSRKLQLQSNGAYVTGYLNVDTLPVGTYIDVTWSSSDDYFYKASSTRASKMNIRDLDIDTSKLYDLELKSFDFRKTDMDTGVFLDTPAQASFGMIAEDVHTILPDLVNLDKDGEPEAVHYKLISVLLLSELKKLKARIEVLEGN